MLINVGTMKTYLAEAYNAARKHSDDPSSQTGAVLINDTVRPVQKVTGVNHFYPGIPPEVEDRRKKLERIEHAERDAIFQLAQIGQVKGATMFCPWSACFDCARAIIGSGVSTLVVHKQRQDLTHPNWKAQVDEAMGWLKSSVRVIEFDGKVSVPPILVSGRLWSPQHLSYVDD